MPTVGVSEKGQVLIPKAIREKYGVKPGGKVRLVEKPDGIVIRPAPEDPIETACGFLEGDFSLTEDLIAEHREELGRESGRGPR